MGFDTDAAWVRPLRELGANLQAMTMTLLAVLLGVALSLVGILLEVDTGQVITVVSIFAFLTALGFLYSLLAAMMTAAEKNDGDPMRALREPLFVTLLFTLVALVVVFVGVVRYATLYL